MFLEYHINHLFMCIRIVCSITADIDTAVQVHGRRGKDSAVLHRRGHAAGHALRAGPVPVRAPALDVGQVHLLAAAEQEERQRRQHERESQQFHENNVRSILAAAALIAIYDGCSVCCCTSVFGHDRIIIYNIIIIHDTYDMCRCVTR